MISLTALSTNAVEIGSPRRRRVTFRRIKSFQAQLDMAESESLPPSSPATARHNMRKARQRMGAQASAPDTSWMTGQAR
jgi:hypothetical protein